jgi:ketosteroid isomerase-like protein
VPASLPAVPAEDAIPGIFDRIYAAFLAGDTETLDSYLHDDITVWVPSEQPLCFGKAGLNGIRSRRPADSGENATTGLTVHDMVIDSHQDVAWVRHVIVAEMPDADPEVFRCTSVWRWIAGSWLQVHSHEELLPGARYPFPDPDA